MTNRRKNDPRELGMTTMPGSHRKIERRGTVAGITRDSDFIPKVRKQLVDIGRAFDVDLEGELANPQEYRCICHNFQGDHEEECSEFNAKRFPKELLG
jgi:hypothetical protein